MLPSVSCGNAVKVSHVPLAGVAHHPTLSCWHGWVQAGSHAEEATRTEEALDIVRSKIETLSSQVTAREQRWVNAGVPWDSNAVKRARFASLHLAQTFMSG